MYGRKADLVKSPGTLANIFSGYEIAALEAVSKGAKNSRQVFNWVKSAGFDISRASIINFCNAMVNDKIFTYTEVSGKGGYHRIYALAYRDMQYLKHIYAVKLRLLALDLDPSNA